MKRDEIIQSILEVSENVRRQWKTMLVAELAGENITLAQLWALSTIATHGPISSRKLADYMYITSGAVTQLVDGLVTDRLVTRQADPNDGRITNLTLTPEGKTKYDILEHKRQEIFMRVFEVFSDDELSVLLTHQQKILQRLGKVQPDGQPNTHKGA